MFKVHITIIVLDFLVDGSSEHSRSQYKRLDLYALQTFGDNVLMQRQHE
jgi:hypothetical protein